MLTSTSAGSEIENTADLGFLERSKIQLVADGLGEDDVHEPETLQLGLYH